MGNLLVRFCEGLGYNRCMAEILWHRRETRRQQRTQTSACSIGRPSATYRDGSGNWFIYDEFLDPDCVEYETRAEIVRERWHWDSEFHGSSYVDVRITPPTQIKTAEAQAAGCRGSNGDSIFPMRHGDQDGIQFCDI